MNHSIKIGFCFGLTSGIITTLGLMVGLHASTHNKLVVLGGILTIAIADAFSDALGMHVAEESERRHTTKEIWQSTLSTFFSKFLFALTFIFPIYFLSLKTAIIISIVWGMMVLAILSWYLAKRQKKSPWRVVSEHLLIAFIVIILTHYTGDFISGVFK